MSESDLSCNFTTFQVEEIQISVPWGHISGKWWGPKDVRPILCLHGWQDNAGTFDKLIPLLPSNVSFLAIDLPGHGLSSWVPNGMAYHAADNIYLLNIILKEYQWDKLSIMAHSMGSLVGFLFSSIFPSKVDMLIGLDALKPHIRETDKLVPFLERHLENFVKADLRNQEKSEPPCYTYDELVERLHLGTYKSITKECCPYLLKRAIKKSIKYPDKYYFGRDSRLKHLFPISLSQETCLALARRIQIPYLFIKAKRSPFYEDEKYYHEAIDVLKESSKFELMNVDSTHHFHLTDPAICSETISNFINKNYPSTVKV